MDTIGIIIQARTGSTRFPDKVILPFYKDKSIIDIIIEKLKTVIAKEAIILATTNLEKDTVLVEKAAQHKIKYFQGSENDVLQRFIETAEKFEVKKIIRVCADNPFIDTTAIKYLIEKFSESTFEYLSFNINGVPSIKSHYGLWAEGVLLNALKKVAEFTDEPVYHEHVTNYIYGNPQVFDVNLMHVDTTMLHDSIRLTIDTEVDFDLMREIYSLALENNIFDTKSLLNFISSNPQWVNTMKSQIDINSK